MFLPDVVCHVMVFACFAGGAFPIHLVVFPIRLVAVPNGLVVVFVLVAMVCSHGRPRLCISPLPSMFSFLLLLSSFPFPHHLVVLLLASQRLAYFLLVFIFAPFCSRDHLLCNGSLSPPLSSFCAAVVVW